MALALSLAATSFHAPALPVTRSRAGIPSMETVKDLEALADAQQIPMGYWDPLGMTQLNLYDLGESGTIGWLRQAEIKHGRVAMAAFVGFCVHANGITFPWALTGGKLSDGPTLMFSDIGASVYPSPLDQWDAVPAAGKMQILGTIFLLEWINEEAKPHYTQGGKPGVFPSIKEASSVPHPVPFDLFDPFGLFKNDSEEKKARGLNVEINNGRAAMLGIFGLISASKGLIVPGLDGLGLPQSTAEPMAFFGPGDVGAWPLIDKMYDNIGAFPWNA